MALGRTYERQECSLARALEVVGERWTLLVLRDCFFGVRRFTDFAARLDIPRAVLTERLKRLVAVGVLERRAQPIGHEYVLTETGQELWPTVFALAQWGARHFPLTAGPQRIFSHAQCGTDLDTAGCCPTCHTTPGPADVLVRPGPGASSSSSREDPISVALNRGPHRLLTPLPNPMDLALSDQQAV